MDLKKIIESLFKNSQSFNSLDSYRMRQTIKRTIETTPLVQNASILNKKSKDKVDKESARDEFAAITGAAGLGAMEIREGASQEEVEATKKYWEYIEALNKGGLNKDEEEEIKVKLQEAKENLIRVRKEYDNAGDYISDTISKANEVIKNLKSPLYIADKKKRKSIFKSSYHGVDDPFYDRLKEIYGEEGLEGYRKERLEAFKNIPLDDVKLASERYKKVNNLLTHVKTLASIAGIVVCGFTLYPQMVAQRRKSNSYCTRFYCTNSYSTKNT